ncbi:hypothetical protein PAXRUDRAFT_12410 [Paxillus rubicundulus Ve08.2h10]|uniref:Uncharacterized protein n=1 Tax=Paxillus rubicundulus Ve08.2h10 TaxID=930991 RepID=A0A0D0E144_9AGAM|nr:hypothetical protein PAXRUDRAFT_12410 [Paxillus rubicundulus Ve08.2h10]
MESLLHLSQHMMSQPTPPLSQSAATPAKHPSKLSSITKSIKKAKEHISKLLKKHSFEDTLIDFTQANLDAINSQQVYNDN